MIRKLEKVKNDLYYLVDGKRIAGASSVLSGNCSGLSGNCSRLSGDCSGLSGNCSGLYGDLDECEISEKGREDGIDITDLIRQ